MKFLSNTVSIQKDTNRLVGGANTDWSLLKPGSLVKLNKENLLYNVSKANKFLIIKDFEVVKETIIRKIKIKGDTEIDLSKNDELVLSYNEYQLFAVFDIIKAGSGYSKDDILYVSGGEPCQNIKDGVIQNTSFIVDKVGKIGDIERISIKDNGRYTITPPIKNEVISLAGTGAVLELEYRIIEQRKALERRIALIKFEAPYTIITLDYELSDKFSEGKLSCQKWELFLDKSYINDTRIDVDCRFFRDYSPNLQIPYFLNNDQSQATLLNYLVNKVDTEIGTIQERLNKLEQK